MREIGRRLAPLPFVVWAVATVVFLVLRIVPGNAAQAAVTAYGTAQQVARARHALGLDKSVPDQYWIYLRDLVHLNFGVSFYSGRSVAAILGETLPVTVELAVAGGIVMILFGLLSGAIAAMFRDTWIDSAISGIAATLFSIPWFFTGVVLLVLFTSVWPVLPGFGRLPPTVAYTPTTHFLPLDALLQNRWDLIGPWLEHLILPALTVGLTSAGLITRVTRSAFVSTSGQDYVRTARSKGMGLTHLYRHHIFRNSSIPIVAAIGLQSGALLGGAVVAEIVFSYPGVGNLLVTAINQRDYPVVEGASMVIATIYVLVNTLTDASYPVLDPRLR